MYDNYKVLEYSLVWDDKIGFINDRQTAYEKGIKGQEREKGKRQTMINLLRIARCHH